MTMPTLPMTTQRFAQAVNRPGGITLAEAAKSANANIDTIRSSALVEISAILDQMYQLGSEPFSKAADLVKLYNFSNTILSVAGVFDMAHLGSVAYSLCELIDRLQLRHQMNNAAIAIHLNSLRLMHTLSPDDMKQAEVVQKALNKLVSSI